MWFCIKCGREMSRGELIKGYCIDCFRKHVDVFTSTPLIDLTICPNCGSWFHSGEWHPPHTEPEILELIAPRELRRYVIDGVEVRSIRVLSWERTERSLLKFNVELELDVEGKQIPSRNTLEVKISYKTCPRCISRSTGKYNYLIQVRFASRDPPREVIDEVLDTITHHISVKSTIVIREIHEGIDIELDENTVVKKILEILRRRYSAKITTSFQATKFDPRRGKWIGITTYVTRIPVFRERDLVIYRGKIGVVKSIDQGKLIVWFPDNDIYEEVDIRDYWKGLLKIPMRIETEILVVKQIGEESIVLENVNKEIKLIKAKNWLKTLKTGEQVILIKVDNVETIIPRGD